MYAVPIQGFNEKSGLGKAVQLCTYENSYFDSVMQNHSMVFLYSWGPFGKLPRYSSTML